MSGDLIVYDVTLSGSGAGLLLHNDDLTFQDRERARPTAKKRGAAGDDRGVPGKWASYLYTVPQKDGSRLAVLPIDNVLALLKEAGKQLKDGRRSLRSAVESSIFGSDHFSLEAILKNSDKFTPVTVSAKEYDLSAEEYVAAGGAIPLLVKRVKVQMARHVRVRPIFASWRASGQIMVRSDAISAEQLNELFSVAGSTIGLCEWRPRYGQFAATCEPARTAETRKRKAG